MGDTFEPVVHVLAVVSLVLLVPAVVVSYLLRPPGSGGAGHAAGDAPPTALGVTAQPRSWRPPVRPALRRPTPAALAAVVVVLALVAVGLLAGNRAGVAFSTPLTLVLAVVLAQVLLRRDERFQVAQAFLLVLHTLVAVVVLLVLARGYDARSGAFTGVRIVLGWAGPEGMPSAPSFRSAVLALAVFRFALPVAVAGALAWVLTTRTRMSRLDRGALLVLGVTLLLLVVGDLVLVVVTLARGALGALPLVLAVLGLLGSLFLLSALVGPVLTGVVVGVRRLVTRRPPGPVPGLVSSVGGRRGIPWRSVGRILRGHTLAVQRLNIVVIVAALVGVVGLSVGYRAFVGDPRRAEVAYQYTDEETVVPAALAMPVVGPGGLVWLRTADGHLATFDPRTRRVETGTLPVGAARLLPGGAAMVALTTEPAPRLVLLSDLDTLRVVATLAPGSSPTLAVTGTRLWVAEQGGRLFGFDLTGRRVAAKTVQPTIAVGAGGGELWTIHRRGVVAPGSPPDVAIRRDAVTLAELSRVTVVLTGDRYVWPSASRTLDLSTGVLAAASGVSGAPDVSRVGPVTKAWVPGADGRVRLVLGASSTTYVFGHDTVSAVLELEGGGTWVVVGDAPRGSAPVTRIARWPGAPAHG